MPQNNNTILGQSFHNKKQYQNVSTPDTDSRAIELVGLGLSVAPDLMWDHSRMAYTSPVSNSQPVSFLTPTNMEDRSLHWLILDNSNNTVAKNFTFNTSYVFLDNMGTQSYLVNPGKILAWFGAVIAGQLQLRLASISTN